MGKSLFEGERKKRRKIRKILIFYICNPPIHYQPTVQYIIYLTERGPLRHGIAWYYTVQYSKTIGVPYCFCFCFSSLCEIKFNNIELAFLILIGCYIGENNFFTLYHSVLYQKILLNHHPFINNKI